MTFGSLFSGIEAASAAWLPLGWNCAWLAEIEPFPCAVLAHHYPDAPNLGDITAADFTARAKALDAVDLIIGGSPCQAFSVAGLRKSLDDDRGNLTLRFVEIVNVLDPAFVVWENVPGVLSTKDNAFGCLLAGLVGEDAPLVPRGGRWTDAGVVDGPQRSLAWRILDAQHFGLAQRRRRVFLLAGRAGERPHPGEVLFEPESLCRDHPSGRGQGQSVAALTSCGVGTCGADDNQAQAGHLVAHTLRAEGFDASEDGTGRGVPLVAFQDRFRGDDGRGYDRPPPASEDIVGSLETVKPWNVAVPILEPSKRCGLKGDPRDGLGIGQPGDPMFTLQAGAQHGVAVSFESRFSRNGRGAPSVVVPPLKAQSGQAGKGDASPLVASGMQVRQLTPRECERLQGFPDDYTLIPYRGKPAEECADGPRYKALGNSMAVPVIRWIGERIMAVIP